MNGSLRVSVIIPTYNRPEYLRQAVASVLAQTFPDLEVIVVDDGSGGETAAMMAAFSDPRVQYIYQENAGRSAARNRGMAAARGEFIALLDDDDLYLPHKLAVQVAFLDSHPDTGLVVGGAQVIAPDGKITGLWKAWQDQPQLALPACLYACPFTPAMVLFRRRLDALDVWFDRETEPAEDKDFWLRLLLAGCRMEWDREIVCAYRQHAGSSQHDKERYHHSRMRLWDKLYARDDLPECVRSEQPAIYAHTYVQGACVAYAAGQMQTGRERLLQSVEANPQAGHGDPPPIVSLIVAVAAHEAGEPAALVNTVFSNLPPALSHLRTYRGYALSALHMQRVFNAHAAGAQPPLREWLQGVRRDPRWLRNRGVWAILVRNLARLPAQATREVASNGRTEP